MSYAACADAWHRPANVQPEIQNKIYLFII